MNQTDPWNGSDQESSEKTTQGFQDDFVVESTTKLELPDSDKYLEALGLFDIF